MQRQFCHPEVYRSPLGRSPPLRPAMRATSPASTGEHTPGKAKPADLVYNNIYSAENHPSGRFFAQGSE